MAKALVVTVEPTLRNRFKAACVYNDKTMTEVISEFMIEYVEDMLVKVDEANEDV